MSEIKGHALKDEFKAWVDTMPGAHNTLHVTGKVEYRSGGLKASLRRAVPQGINTEILILEVVDTQHGDIAIKPIVIVDVEPYSEKDAKRYKEVTIRSASPEFTIPASVVS